MKRRYFFFLLVVLGMVCTSCVPAFPDDFSVSLQWGYNGMYLYDSTSGELIKGAEKTVYQLTEEERQTIRSLLRRLDAQSYPDTYDPNEHLATSPLTTLILTVRTDTWEKTIAAEEIALGYVSDDRAGQKFLDACYGIVNILENTAQWQTLPEPDLFYLE